MRFRGPAGLRPATRPRTFGVRCAPAKHQRYAGPIPAPAPGPLRLRRLRRRPAGPGPGLRPAAPRSGPRLRRPRLRLARAGPLRGPGLGYRAGSRPSPRLRQPPGGPRCGGGVSGSRRLAPAGPSATGPGVVPPALRAAAGPPAGVGGPWAAPCGRRAPSVPPRVPPALPPSLRAGGGPFGPPGAPPPGGRLGGPAGRLDQPPPPGLAGDGGRRRGCGRAQLVRECLCSLWEAPGSARCTLGIVLFMGPRGGPCRAASCSSDPAARRPLGYAALQDGKKRGIVPFGTIPLTSTLHPYSVFRRTWPHTAGTPWRKPWWSLRRYD